MNKIDKITYKEIKRISPSQFYSMKNCAYKSLLAEAFEKKPLLPISANAYFGTVMHKILELIAKGIIKNEDTFNKAFDDQVRLQEKYLKRLHYDFFVPLQKNVKHFGIKKILLKNHLRSVSENPVTLEPMKFHSEKWYESKDKMIAGKIDLIVERKEGVEIIDFKTGAITHEVLDEDGEMFSEIKNEYKEQLKLYGYLYFETTGKYPIQLTLIDLSKQKFSIDFTQSECNLIFEEAKALLKATNDSINNDSFDANPSEANCKFCLYRPACSFFLKSLEDTNSFNDVSGIVKKVVRYQNGNVSVFLESGRNNITVTGFPSERYNELCESKESKMNIFNLRKEATEMVYSTTKTTMIYE